MRNTKILIFYLLIVFLSPSIPNAHAQQTGTCPRSLGEQYLDVNNVRARIVNTGGLFYRGEPHVYNVPRFTESNAIFTSGIWIAGRINDQLHAAAARYNNNEFWAGPLDDNGNPPTDCVVYDRVYKVSRDDVANYEAGGIAAWDLADWPTGLGAPTLDANGDPVDLLSQPLASRVDRTVDLAAGERPDILGDMAVWWIMNDLGNTHLSTDSPALGVEVHGMAFAARTSIEAINNATLYKYRIFNRNTSALEEAYFGIFADPDLGDFGDDYVGSDSLLSIGYVYNSDNEDGGDEGYGTRPPAVGFIILKSPSAENDGLDNNHDGRVDEAGEQLGLSHFMSIYNGGDVTEDPTTGLHYYNYMQGRWKDGRRLTIGGIGRDFSTVPVNYSFPADPTTGEFWSEMNSDGFGTPNRAGDRRFIMSVGPFSLDPEEEIEIVFAIVYALGQDRLDSVTEMKIAAVEVRQAFEDGFSGFPQGSAPQVSIQQLSPGHGVTGQPLNLSLEWAPVSEQDWFQIELSFPSGIELIFSSTTSLQPENLLTNQVYGWKVRAVNAFGFGPWSELWEFGTGEASLVIGNSMRFLVTQNAAGPLIPPDMAAFGFAGFPTIPDPSDPPATIDTPTPGYQQSTNDSAWGITVGGGGRAFGPISLSGSFLSRVTRAGANIRHIYPFDYEIRFTANGGLGWYKFSTNTVIFVPFELWNIGIDTPNDPSDDYRMIPILFDENDDDVFNISGDHAVSGGLNDPFTDRIYWYNPTDTTPGENGYEAFFSDISQPLGDEVFARMVLVNWNGGEAPPYNADMPERGTVFRIEIGDENFAPILASPSNGTQLEASVVSFFWSGPDIGAFQIQVSSEPNFSSLIFDESVSALNFLASLDSNGRYYWRIRSATGAWSQTWTFEIVGGTTAIAGDENQFPGRFQLFENYPNPFNPITSIRFDLPQSEHVRLSVYNVIGQVVERLVDGQMGAASHEYSWDASGLPSGLYFYTLTAGEFSETKTMVLLK